MALDQAKLAAARYAMQVVVARKRIEFATTCHLNTAGQPLNFTDFHFWKQPYADVSGNIVLRFCVQEGKTEWDLVDTFACAAVGLRVFCVYPKMELRNAHVGDRVDRTIATVAEYAQLIINAAGSRDSTTLKHFGEGTIRYVSSNVDSELIATPADVLKVDEVDSCDHTKMHLAEDRIQRSPYQFTRRVGTPTTPGSSTIRNIDYFFTQSNQQHYHIPCPHCGRMQALDFFKHVVEPQRNDEGQLIDFKILDRTWTERCGREPKMPCRYCGKTLNRHAEGAWVASNPESKLYSGYTLSKMYSPITTMDTLLRTFLNALNNPFAMQRFHNSLLGVPYVGIGDRISPEVLEKCSQVMPYHTGIEPITQCSMGVDVNGPCFDVWISDYPFIKEGVLYRRLVHADRVKDLDTVHGLIADYGVSTCVCDAGPEVRLMLDFQEKAKCEVWRCSYDTSEGLQAKDMRLDEENGLITIDRTSSLDLVLQMFLNHETLMPTDYAGMANGEIEKHLTSSVRKLEITDKGKQRYVWVGDPDHLLHACNYDLMAARIGGFTPYGTDGGAAPVSGGQRNTGPDITNGMMQQAYREIRSGSQLQKVLQQMGQR